MGAFSCLNALTARRFDFCQAAQLSLVDPRLQTGTAGQEQPSRVLKDVLRG
jgi:hypothetical protein